MIRVYVKRSGDAGAYQDVPSSTPISSVLEEGEIGLIKRVAMDADYILQDGDFISVKFVGHDNG